jgi:acetyl-CoA carboxylase biotin carboxyl carrier protein
MTDGASTSEEPPVNGLLRVIDRLEQMLEASELVEMEVEAGGMTIVLRKPEAIAPVAVTAFAATADAAGAESRSATTAAATSAAAANSDSEAPSPFHAVRAPLTGVYYGSPSPGAAPYVNIGSPVSQGQVIGLIEAMKLFNEIKSDASGIVRKIAAETGALVKAKQPLIEIEIS